MDSALFQPLENWSLRDLGLLQQGLIDEASLFRLSPQILRAAHIGLVSQLDEELGLLAVGSMFRYPWRYLGRRSQHRPRSRRGFAQRKHDNHGSRETKQNAE